MKRILEYSEKHGPVKTITIVFVTTTLLSAPGWVISTLFFFKNRFFNVSDGAFSFLAIVWLSCISGSVAAYGIYSYIKSKKLKEGYLSKPSKTIILICNFVSNLIFIILIWNAFALVFFGFSVAKLIELITFSSILKMIVLAGIFGLLGAKSEWKRTRSS